MRIRAAYRVGEDLKFLGNLDMLNLMGRALRRADVPFALSEGFNPHIKLSLGTVLPVGVWGKNEYFDLELSCPQDTTQFMAQLNPVLPPAMHIKKCIEIPADAPSLMKTVNAASYTYVMKPTHSDYSALADKWLSQSILPVPSHGKKKGAAKDLRPGLYKIDVNTQEDFVIINIWVSVGEPVNVRYDELLDLLHISGIHLTEVMDVYRSGNYILENNNFYSPMEKVR